jgi:pimeloyl-ACP methyl ester carboxylesterase
MLYPFHLDTGSVSPAGVLQALGIEWLLQRQDVPRTVAGVQVFASAPISYYQEVPGIYPPNFIILQDGGDWWFFSAGVNDRPSVGGSIVGGIGTNFSPGVLVHAFFEGAYNAYVKPQLDSLIGTPGAGVKFHFAGHSYGGALAFRAGVDYAARFGNDRVEVLTIGQPRLFSAQFPPPNFKYTRIAFPLDPVPQMAPNLTSVQFGNFLGNVGANLNWQHFGTGLGVTIDGTLFPYPNTQTQLTAFNLALYSTTAQWHNFSNYWTALKAWAGSQFAFNTTWNHFFNLVETNAAYLDLLPSWSPPNFHSVYDSTKFNQIYFGGQNVIPSTGPVTFVVLDNTYGPPALDNAAGGQNFFLGGSSVMGLYQVEIHYAAFNNSWKERYCTNAAGTAQALKFGIADLAPFLSWRPPGTIITGMKASLIANPRLGDIKHLQTGFGTPSTTNRRGVTNDCALVEMRFGGQKVTVRSYRGWQDGLIQYNADGTPANVAAAQGPLNIMATALRTSPAWSVLGWQPKTNSPRNYYPILSLTNNNDGTCNLTLSAASWAAVNWLSGGGQILIQGPRNRNLPGLYGRFQVLASASPNLQVNYSMLFGQATWNQIGLTVRPYVPVEVPFDAIIFSDWRAHKTADPIDLERGRGRKALTRR